MAKDASLLKVERLPVKVLQIMHQFSPAASWHLDHILKKSSMSLAVVQSFRPKSNTVLASRPFDDSHCGRCKVGH